MAALDRECVILEIAYGKFDENDIMRIEDDYQRAAGPEQSCRRLGLIQLRADTYLTLVELKILKGKKSQGLSIYLAKKNITINSEGGAPVLEITNDYGNSLRCEISDSYHFDNLVANLWQFVKDSQH